MHMAATRTGRRCDWVQFSFGITSSQASRPDFCVVDGKCLEHADTREASRTGGRTISLDLLDHHFSNSDRLIQEACRGRRSYRYSATSNAMDLEEAAFHLIMQAISTG